MGEVTPVRVAIAGSTGSIGISTLSVLAAHPEDYQVLALTAATQTDKLLEQCLAVKPRYAAMLDSKAASALATELKLAGSRTEVLSGIDALCQLAAHPDADIVMAAIVGSAGLLPTLAAVEQGKTVLLANKEALVMSGELFISKVKRHGATLLPIDSEHNAIFQCLPAPLQQHTHDQQIADFGISKLLLTGSGGPFLTTALTEFDNITPAQAVAHPNWSMGHKISVDSATMMNKGLEFIEARWLFNCQAADIDVVIHPQSIIHSMVQYTDGSVLAQLGQPGYDLVSLLQDARRDVSAEVQASMVTHFVEEKRLNPDTFGAAYAVLGAQRTLRILGIFARLCLHGGKPQYLPLIPRVWRQLWRNLAHPALGDLARVCAALPEPSAENIERIRAQCGTMPLR